MEQELARCYQPLFDLMSNEHDKILLVSEMDEIIKSSFKVNELLSPKNDKQGKETIQISGQKENPKAGAITYHIANVQDIADAVTTDNLESFISDLRMILNAHLIIKSIDEELLKLINMPITQRVFMPSFDWIDD